VAPPVPAAVGAKKDVFDLYVHAWNGEQSIKEYLAQLERANQNVNGFGGVLIARAGEIDGTRQKSNELVALATRYPKLMPIASVHPCDGMAALEELKRLASVGVKAIKLHPHTQQFEVADARVLELCRLAGTLGIVILMDKANIIPDPRGGRVAALNPNHTRDRSASLD
jgi:uncharacterized protein